MDIVKQRIALAKGVIRHNCDIWQWAGIGPFRNTATYFQAEWSTHMSNCEYVCSQNASCAHVTFGVLTANLPVRFCNFYNSMVSDTFVPDAYKSFELKYRFCYGEYAEKQFSIITEYH